jgi:nucleoside-diphosphate-sugar epimerase
MFKKILITGSSGFIGHELCNQFLKKNYTVYGLDKITKKYSNKILFFKCDIMNKNNLLKVFKEINPQIIVHLAAKADLKSNDINYYRENFIGTRKNESITCIKGI